MNNKQSTNSLEEFLTVLREHEIKTFSKFVCIKSERAFTEEKIAANEIAKVLWNGTVPHLNIGRRWYACHQGKDKNLYQKKRQAEKRDSKVIFIGNGGLGCGIDREFLVNLFSPYGPLQNVVLLSGKPYAFVVFKHKEDAIKGMTAINGQNLTSGHTFYLSYICESDLPQESYSRNSWPRGLILLENFVSEDEEIELLAAINFIESGDCTSLKHRKVMHYGYEFIYGKNNVDKNKSLDAKIPEVCYPHLQRLFSDGYIAQIPDQLTVNQYLPGQGIPPHVDTHSAFEDGIISLSLGSQVVMDFYHPTEKTVHVVLPRRSILIMTGESRYLWKHGITPRKTDIIPESTNEGYSLNLCHRSPRTSFTFRTIRQWECDCDYADQCDSQITSKPNDLVDEEEAKELERKYVYQVYENIADHFSDTRYKPWPRVFSFLNTVPVGSLILDVGCGNGKNLGLSNGCYEIGCDASSKLAEVCSSKNIQVLTADCLRLPFRGNCADVVICIAVIHHLSTKARRAKAIKEIIRVLRPKGQALIYVWAFEQDRPEGPSNYLKSSKVACERKNENETILATEIQLSDCKNSPKTIQMPVHKNRTNFQKQDMLVPWKDKKSACQPKDSESESEYAVHHRYYHVFAEGELENLVSESEGCIINSYYDKGNWCVLFEK